MFRENILPSTMIFSTTFVKMGSYPILICIHVNALSARTGVCNKPLHTGFVHEETIQSFLDESLQLATGQWPSPPAPPPHCPPPPAGTSSSYTFSSSYTSSSDLAASSWPGSESSLSTSGARSTWRHKTAVERCGHAGFTVEQ